MGQSVSAPLMVAASFHIRWVDEWWLSSAKNVCRGSLWGFIVLLFEIWIEFYN
jgi:hypothetical protein